MAKRELLYVRVETLPNGYSFTVGKNEYMCWTPEQLVDEVFTRIAIGEREYLDKENVSAIMEACAKWQTIGDAVSANAKLLAETRRAQRHECLANTAQAKANERAEKIKKERDELWNENIQLNMELETLSKKMKYFDNILVGDLPKDDRHKKNHKKR